MNPIQTLHQLEITDVDIYILVTTPEQIIINNISTKNGQEGITVFDYMLIKKEYIPFALKESVGIYSFFKKSNGREIIFYCPENECLIYVNIPEKKTFSISLSEICQNVVFSPIYHWSEGALILSDYNQNFYRVLINDRKIIFEKKSEIQEAMATFFDFYEQTITNAIKVYPNSYGYISKDRINIKFVDFINKKKISVPNIGPDAHDYDYRNGIFLLIGEDEIILLSSEKNLNERIQPKKSYKFLRASFLDDSTFVTLSSNGLNNVLTVFRVE